MGEINYEILDKHVFVTKLAGFEHTEYIQKNQTKEKNSNDDIPMVQGKNIRNGFFVEEMYLSNKNKDQAIELVEDTLKHLVEDKKFLKKCVDRLDTTICPIVE